MTDPSNKEVEIQNIDSSLASLVTKAEYDVQIATARQWPRSIRGFINSATEMVTLSEAIADDCIYALPRGGKTIEGPSVRFAEIILHAWGHTRAGARIVNEDSRFVTAQGVCHDLQSNTLIAFEVRRRITDSKGRRYNDDMIGVTGNAASSIALRNAILRVIPKALWEPIYQEARRVVVGDSKTLANKRASAITFLAKFGVTEPMILAKFEIKGQEDITLEHLPILRGFATALKEGEATVEDLFPELAKAEAEKRIWELKAQATEKKTEYVNPETGEISDWDLVVEELIAGLMGAKDLKALADYMDEISEQIKTISQNGGPAVCKKWAQAYAKRSEELTLAKK